MSLNVHCLPALSDNYMWLLHETSSGEVIVIDPSEAAPVEAFLTSKQWTLNAVWNTHHHWDHIGGNKELSAKYGCDVIGFDKDAARIPGISRSVSEGEKLIIGDETAEVLFVPGHTFGHIAYYFAKSKKLFIGDTLFAMGCGRLFEGTPAQLKSSLEKLTHLPKETRVYCGHEYTEKNLQFSKMFLSHRPALKKREREVTALRQRACPTVPFSLAEELETNPFLNTQDKELRMRLGLSSASDLEVFSELRRRKDSF